MKNHYRFALITIAALSLIACNDSTSNGDDNDTATISLASSNPDTADGLSPVIEAFESNTGHTVNTRGYRNGTEAGEEAAIRDGDAPDLLVFPQPGVLMDLANDGLMKPLRPESYGVLDGSIWSPYLTHEQELYGGFFRIDNKQSIWYSRELFDQAGVQPPTTRQEFGALINELKDSDAAEHVFCVSIQDGWAATDLIERAMLTPNDADTYRQWVRNETRFDGPEFESALNATQEFMFDNANPDMTDRGIVSAAQGLLADENGARECFMHFQAGWIITFAYGNHLATSDDDGDIDFFMQPYASDTPVALVGGAFISKGTDNIAADEFIEFLFSEEGMALVAESEYPAYHHDNAAVSEAIDNLPNAYIREKLWDAIADTAEATGGDGVVFDASDLFPSAFARTFGEEVISFAKDEQDAVETGNKLQEAWDSQ